MPSSSHGYDVRRLVSVCALLSLGLGIGGKVWAALPLEAFAAPDAIEDAAISPDGHYLAEVLERGDHRFAVVLDRQSGAAPKLVLSNGSNGFEITACNWVNTRRLLCSYRGVVYQSGVASQFTRLVAVDADGKNMLVLLDNSSASSDSQFDSIIDWNAGPDTVLIEASESLLSGGGPGAQGAVIGRVSTGPYPAVFALNVVTGKSRIVVHSIEPVLHFISDFHGNPRAAYGLEPHSKTIQYLVRSQKNSWQRLLQYEAFSKTAALVPVALDSESPDRAYAIGGHQGRQALWAVDLSDKQSPQLIYANPKVDVGVPLLLKDGHMLGVTYDTERPHVYYTDTRFQALMAAVDAALPDTSNLIVDATADRGLLIVRGSSDVEPGAYYLFDTVNHKLVAMGRGNDALALPQLGRMLFITYPARDGTLIPGYLTKPPGASADHLPLIVMPHGGPIARDSWRYFFLQQFLVNRGYAVLQMNFRGSGGYGTAWFDAARQDWGGQTYDDIVDGAKWAVSSGLADPKRIAVVGWSFGGYAALLGAVRDGDLFRCAVSIAGISDLSLLEDESTAYINSAVIREQIGTDRAKLRADSPRRHAAEAKVPVLLVHGDRDATANFEQSEAMATALKSAGRPYELTRIKDADHDLARASDRLTLLQAVSRFLDANDPVTAP